MNAPAWSRLHEDDELDSGSSWPLGSTRKIERASAGLRADAAGLCWPRRGPRVREGWVARLGSWVEFGPWPIEN
jgi:hypothetical protein